MNMSSLELLDLYLKNNEQKQEIQGWSNRRQAEGVNKL